MAHFLEMKWAETENDFVFEYEWVEVICYVMNAWKKMIRQLIFKYSEA